MDEQRLWETGLEEQTHLQEKDEQGVHSVKIQNLGELREISQLSFIAINKLVNIGCKIVEKVLFPNRVASQAYLEIIKKGTQFKKDTEFHIIRIALEIMGEILRERRCESIYNEILSVIEELEQDGIKASLQECILEAIRMSIKDPKFKKTLSNK